MMALKLALLSLHSQQTSLLALKTLLSALGQCLTVAAATEKFRIGEVIYTPRFIGAGIVPTNAWLTAGAGTTAIAAAKLTAGPQLTTPLTGAFEYDGYAAYIHTTGNKSRRIASGTVLSIRC